MVHNSYSLHNSTVSGNRKMIVFGVILLVLIPVLAAGGYLIYRYLSATDFFQLTSVSIEGDERASKKDIMALSGVHIQTSLLALNLDMVKTGVESHDWVESATVDRRWPNRLSITIKERVPVAITVLSDTLYYLDRHGVVFAMVLPSDDLDYPVISGLTRSNWPDVLKGSSLRRVLRFIHYAGRGNVFLPGQNISEINLTVDGDMILFLVNRPFPIYLGQGKVRTEYHRLARVLRSLYNTKEFAKTIHIDMHYMQDKALVSLAGDRG